MSVMADGSPRGAAPEFVRCADCAWDICDQARSCRRPSEPSIVGAPEDVIRRALGRDAHGTSAEVDALDALVADRDALQERAEKLEADIARWGLREAEAELVAENESLRAERDSARRERGQAVDALRKIAGAPAPIRPRMILDIAAATLVELGESKP